MVTDANDRNSEHLLIKSRPLTSVRACMRILVKLNTELFKLLYAREFSITLKLVSHWIKDNSHFTSDLFSLVSLTHRERERELKLQVAFRNVYEVSAFCLIPIDARRFNVMV